MSKSTWLCGAACAAISLSSGTATQAQDGAAADDVPSATKDQDTGDDVRLVTGSRIPRSDSGAVSELRVLDPAAAASFGVVDAATLVQESVVASGPQIDASINTSFSAANATELPPDNGPGSATASLRGLDAERTLVLLNGRRIAPAGAGGVPPRPDLTLIPASLVERVEILPSGASSIYGADAVAGVVNIITKSGFEGVEIEAFRSQPDADGGEQSRLSFIAGVSSDRGAITFGGEFYERNRIAVGDRDYARCKRDIYDIFSRGERVSTWAPCRSGFPDSAAQVVNDPFADLYFYAPGRSGTNFGGGPVPDWVDAYDDGLYPDLFAGNITWDVRQWQFDSPTSLLPEVRHDFGAYNDQDERLDADLLQGVRRFSFMTQGTYDLEIADVWAPTFYFEQAYSNRQTIAHGVAEQALPIVPGAIPQLRDDGLDFIRDGDGDLVLFDNPLNPFADNDVKLIIILDEDFDQVRKTEVEQIRFVGGLEESFDSLFGFGSNWRSDVFGAYDRSLGAVSQKILFEPNVFFGTTLQYLNQGGGVNCGLPPSTSPGNPFTTWADSFAADPTAGLSAAGCIPLNWFDASVLDDGRFATDAERDFATALRTNRTVVEQMVFGGHVSGELFDLPGGPAAAAFGFEHRIDKIAAAPDVVVVRGLQASEVSQSEGAARGKTYQNDVFAEIELPLASGQFLAEELTLNGSVRRMSSSGFGDETAYAARGVWSPANWLSLRGNYATAVRAPTLREQFVNAASFDTVSSAIDPCAANSSFVFDPFDVSTYNRNLDPRSDNLLAQCVASGADPRVLAGDGFSISVPLQQSGNQDLGAETADTYGAGFTLHPTMSAIPGLDRIIDELQFSADYWNIEIENTIETLTPLEVVNACFDGETPTLDDPLCANLSRSRGSNRVYDYLAGIEVPFANRGEAQADGVDFRLRVGKELALFGRPVDLTFDAEATYQLSFARQLDAADPATRSQIIATNNFPRWNGVFTWSAWADDFRLNWRTRWTGQVQDAPRAVHTDVDGELQSGLGAGTFFGRSSRCAFFNPNSGASPAPGLAGDLDLGTGRGGVNCVARTREFTEDYFESDASLSYLGPDFTITVGVSNVFDAEPELVHDGIANRNNVVTSMGYDLYGRSWFVTLSKSF